VSQIFISLKLGSQLDSILILLRDGMKMSASF